LVEGSEFFFGNGFCGLKRAKIFSRPVRRRRPETLRQPARTPLAAFVQQKKVFGGRSGKDFDKCKKAVPVIEKQLFYDANY